jgi:hypothetical protein
MPMFQARIIRQEVAITDVEGDTLETAKEKLRVWGRPSPSYPYSTVRRQSITVAMRKCGDAAQSEQFDASVKQV